MRRNEWAALAVLIPLVVIGAIFAGRALRTDAPAGTSSVELEGAADADTFDHDYVIPAGTADRIDAGDVVEIVPRALDVRVGEVIRIVNDDDEGHVVGVFYVGAGETLTQRFSSPGELSGACSVHSDGEFTVRVSA